MDIQHPFAAIVDYGLGNLHSVQQACTYVGLTSVITNSKQVLLSADAVILPGVGAYGDAMQELHRLDLAEVLLDLARSEKPLVGICLGLQLLMTESSEFGHHRGLGIIEGPVVRFDMPKEDGKILKIPHVNWNSILHTPHNACWDKTLLSRVKSGTFMYFVHSYTVQPRDAKIILSTTEYGDAQFCSSIGYENIFACQFHPERSGPEGIKIYHNLKKLIQEQGCRNHEER